MLLRTATKDENVSLPHTISHGRRSHEMPICSGAYLAAAIEHEPAEHIADRERLTAISVAALDLPLKSMHQTSLGLVAGTSG